MAIHDITAGRDKSDRPRQNRGATVSTERRYRYPQEEVWEVSEERWRVAEAPYNRRRTQSATEAGR